METNEFHFGQGESQPHIEALPQKEVEPQTETASQPSVDIVQPEQVHIPSDKMLGGEEMVNKVVDENQVAMETQESNVAGETHYNQASPVKQNDASPVKHNDVSASQNDVTASQNDVTATQNDVTPTQNDVSSSEMIVTENNTSSTENDVSATEKETVEVEKDSKKAEEEDDKEVMEQDDSAPTQEEETNHRGEGETHVEEHVEQDGHVEESTTVPVIEEPVESEENQTPQQNNVEISDVTNTSQVEESKMEDEEKTDEQVLMEQIDSAYQCLDDYIASVDTEAQDLSKVKQCMGLLSDIRSLALKTRPPTPQQNSTKSSKKGKKSGASKTKNHVEDPLEDVNLKDIAGLCVFAKWPNSGWFYPGVVRDLSLDAWKSSPSSTTLTVTFYDGLERDMKCINIFPASLIPDNSVLFDLDQETDLTTSSIHQQDNWVQYSVTSPDDSQPQLKDFDKMAIKGVHMKTIKHNYDTTNNSTNKQETIVTGRRVRGKSSMFNEDYVSTSSPRQTEKRKGNQIDDNTPAKPPAKRKSSSKDEDESAESTPSRSSSKRRQVNGTKSTPRRRK